MNKLHKTTLFDRLKDAFKAFHRKPYQTLRIGMDLKRCDECEYKNRDDEPIELNSFSVGGNINHKDRGCHIALWYDDGSGRMLNEAGIHLSQKRVQDLIKSLLDYLEE